MSAPSYVGQKTVGGSRLAIDASRVRATLVGPLGAHAWAGAVVAYLEVDPVAASPVPFRAFIRSEGAGLYGHSEEFVLPRGAPGQWVTMPLTRAFELSDWDSHRIGVHSGATGLKVASNAGAANEALLATAAYSSPVDAAGDLSGITTSANRLSVFAPATPPWVPPDLGDEDLSLLPWCESQQALSTPPLPDSALELAVGFFGERHYPARGANALVPLGDPQGLLGERVRVTNGGESVVVYVRDESDLAPDGIDLALTRPAYARLSPLWTEGAMTVEVLG